MSCIKKFLIATTLCASSLAFADTPHTSKVVKKNIHNALFFVGKLMPVKTVAINSPISGHVETMNFSYGQVVHKGDLLMTLESSEFSKNLQSAFQKYLTAKDKYNNDKETFAGTKMLYKAGVTQRNTYLSSQSSFNSDVVAFYQAKIALEDMLQKAHIDKDMVEAIKLGNIDDVKKMLNYRLAGYKIRSKLTGIALYPGQTGEKSNQKLNVGKDLKEGQTVLTVGSLKGYKATINVSEVSINKIKVGMPVTIRGDGFPGITLHGKVSHVSSQASPKHGNNGSGSQFEVSVTIDPSLKTSGNDQVRIGMTCRVSINSSQKDQLVVPMSALAEKNNRTVVIRLKGGKQENVPVQIGNTTPDGHVIIHGNIKPGEQVLLNDD